MEKKDSSSLDFFCTNGVQVFSDEFIAIYPLISNIYCNSSFFSLKTHVKSFQDFSNKDILYATKNDARSYYLYCMGLVNKKIIREIYVKRRFWSLSALFNTLGSLSSQGLIKDTYSFVEQNPFSDYVTNISNSEYFSNSDYISESELLPILDDLIMSNFALYNVIRLAYEVCLKGERIANLKKEHLIFVTKEDWQLVSSVEYEDISQSIYKTLRENLSDEELITKMHDELLTSYKSTSLGYFREHVSLELINSFLHKNNNYITLKDALLLGITAEELYLNYVPYYKRTVTHGQKEEEYVTDLPSELIPSLYELASQSSADFEYLFFYYRNNMFNKMSLRVLQKYITNVSTTYNEKNFSLKNLRASGALKLHNDGVPDEILASYLEITTSNISRYTSLPLEISSSVNEYRHLTISTKPDLGD